MIRRQTREADVVAFSGGKWRMIMLKIIFGKPVVRSRYPAYDEDITILSRNYECSGIICSTGAGDAWADMVLLRFHLKTWHVFMGWPFPYTGTIIRCHTAIKSLMEYVTVLRQELFSSWRISSFGRNCEIEAMSLIRPAARDSHVRKIISSMRLWETDIENNISDIVAEDPMIWWE